MKRNRRLYSVIMVVSALLVSESNLRGHSTLVHGGDTSSSLTADSIDRVASPSLGSQRNAICQGSVNEDEGTRPLNHFYDPVTGQNTIPLSTSTARARATALWSDFTTEVSGGDGGAYSTLGQVLHLVEDMTSPAHVHNDPHPSGDDFEAWGASNYAIADSVLSAISPASFSGDIGQAVHNLATYSYNFTSFAASLPSNPSDGDTGTGELADMFTIVYDDGGLLGDGFWIMAEVGDGPGKIGNQDWWECEGNAGRYYLENIGSATPSTFPRSFAYGSFSSGDTMCEIYGSELFPKCVEYVSGILWYVAGTYGDKPRAVHYHNSTTPGTSIRIQFDQEMDAGTFSNSTVQVSGKTCSYHYEGTGCDDNELLVTPSTAFSYSQTVYVTLTTGVRNLWGRQLAQTYSFSFTIQDPPANPPTSISVSVSSNDTSIEPYDTITISGSAMYNTGADVDGTATINTGTSIYTTPVVNGHFERQVVGPSSSRNVTVSVGDGSLTGSGSVYVSVSGNGGTPSYDLDTHVVWNVQDEGNGYCSYSYKDAFRTTDSEVNGLFLIDDANLDHDLDFALKFYDPNGNQYGSTLTGNDAFSRDWEWGYWWWGYLISGESMAQNPGKYKVKFYVDGDRKATHYYVVAWDFTQHFMCKGFTGDWQPVNETTVFSTSDSRAVSLNHFEYRAQGIEMKNEFYAPDGSLYATETHTAPDDLGSHEWQAWYRNANWIYIQGHAAEYKCGDWTVKFLLKNPATGSWQEKYVEYFRIEEPTAPNVTIALSPTDPIEAQAISLAISASDNNHLQKVTVHWYDGSWHTNTWNNINAPTWSGNQSCGASIPAGTMFEFWAETWDESGNRAESAHQSVLIEAETVSAPMTPTGPTLGASGQQLQFSARGSSTSLQADVEYQFDWGDGTALSAWVSASVSHIWTTDGEYSVRCRARSQPRPSRLSGWSGDLLLSISGLPVVTTATVSDLTPTDVSCGGEVTAEGGSSVTGRGVCWGTTPGLTVTDDHTVNGSGVGVFTSSLTGLSPGTRYYVRAYATNGSGTAYGSEVTFTTPMPLPFGEDFDDQPLASLPEGWEDLGDAAVTVEVVNDVFEGDSGRSVHFLDSTDSGGAQIQCSLSQTNRVVLEYYMCSATTSDEGAFVVLYGNLGTDFCFCFRPSGDIGIHGGKDGWVEPSVMTYSANTWYYVRRELSCVDNTGTLYIEELTAPLGDAGNRSATYSRGSDYANAVVWGIRMFSSGSLGADAYVDGLMVRNTYTVTFDLGDHGTRIGGGELVQIVPHGGTPTPPTVVVENGWIANGWDKAFDNVTSDLTVTAQYVQTYTVTFDLGDHGARTGGGELSQTVNHGDAAIEPTFTTDDGWGFTGWDTAFDNVTSDLTVTAQYVTKTYTVTFDLGNHGTRTGGGELSQMIDHGDAAVEPTLTVEDGWTRTGWDTAFNNVTADLTVTALYSANPEAVADSYTTPQDTALAVAAPGVLANDTDAESDALAAVKLTDPSHGTLALAADGSFTYTPTAGYFGPDSFTYRAKDATGESGATTVTIAVERTYALVVVSGSGSGSYAAGEEIATTAGTPPAGQVFSGWVTDPVGFGANLADAAACSTTFTMPASDVTLTATYSEAPPEWAVELTVTGAYPDVLTFGMQADATDGWDPGVDDDYPLPGPGQACLAADDLTIEVDPKSRTNGTRY